MRPRWTSSRAIACPLLADKADDLFSWLKDNKYNYSGDQTTLDYYIQKKWFFTVMKIDTNQMKKNADGSCTGDVTPTRFSCTALGVGCQ